jgi:amino acid permease
MSVSATGCGVSLLTVGLYSYLKDNDHDVANLKWLPLICLSLYMLFGAIGMFTVYFVIISEVLSQKVKKYHET